MKSNEEYLDELLNAMSEEETAKENTSGPMDQAMIDALLAATGNADAAKESEEETVKDNASGPMDQAMIDALLEAGNADAAKESEEETAKDNASGPMDQAMIDALLEAANADAGTEDIENENEFLENSMIDTELLAAELEGVTEESGMSQEEQAGDMLAQLMEEMQDVTAEDTQEDAQEEYESESLMTEESIDALLSAAKNSASESVQEDVSYQTSSSSEIEEIEALLGMSDSGEVLDENMALLQMLEEAGSFTEEPKQIEDVQAMDIAELDSLLAKDNSESSDVTDNAESEAADWIKEATKEKKTGGLKEFFGKIFAALVEEVPEKEVAEKDSLNLSEENKDILKQLDKEEAKKIKAKEKKEEKEQRKQAKKAKKEEKQKKALEKKAGKLMKEKKIKTSEAPGVLEKKLPKKKVRVTFVFAFSILAAILVVVYFVPPLLSVNKARSAYDKGEYLEAYKEYYGQKLSEEDEKKFQASTVIMRMKSNLDGYNSYMKFDNEVYAIHSLLEAVHIRDDAFAKAQEFDVLSQVSSIYNEILELLSGNYGLTEDAAMELVKEKSDVTYTKTLEALAGGSGYVEVEDSEVSQDNLLPEEEGLFLNAD